MKDRTGQLFWMGGHPGEHQNHAMRQKLVLVLHPGKTEGVHHCVCFRPGETPWKMDMTEYTTDDWDRMHRRIDILRGPVQVSKIQGLIDRSFLKRHVRDLRPGDMFERYDGERCTILEILRAADARLMIINYAFHSERTGRVERASESWREDGYCTTIIAVMES